MYYLHGYIRVMIIDIAHFCYYKYDLYIIIKWVEYKFDRSGRHDSVCCGHITTNTDCKHLSQFQVISKGSGSSLMLVSNIYV